MRYQILASAPLFPKFVSEGAAMYHELRKRGTSVSASVLLAAVRDAADVLSMRKISLDTA
jgi:hypothetical protein